MLATVECILACFLAGIGCVLQHAVAAFLIAQMSTAQAHLYAFLIAMELFRAGDLFLVTAASADLCHDFQALAAAIGMASHVAEM
jgi:hypothetical protein